MEYDVGRMVVFLCSNPAVGFIKRIAKNNTWADVYWIQGINSGYTSRVKVNNIRPLNGILNYWMELSGYTGVSFKNANRNFFLPPEK